MIASQWCSGKYARVLIERSGIAFPKGKYDLLSMFDIVNLFLKKAMEGDRECLILFSWFGVLWQSAGFDGGLGEKVLFRAG